MSARIALGAVNSWDCALGCLRGRAFADLLPDELKEARRSRFLDGCAA
jgi:hypothetical protein